MPLPTVISRGIWEKLLSEARKTPGIECCGLLGGRGGRVTSIYPAPNHLESATDYEITAPELFRLIREIRGAGEQLVGIYHSHPTTENRPSVRDVERAHYPDVAYMIVSPRDAVPNPVRAFSIRDSVVAELRLEIV